MQKKYLIVLSILSIVTLLVLVTANTLSSFVFKNDLKLHVPTANQQQGSTMNSTNLVDDHIKNDQIDIHYTNFIQMSDQLYKEAHKIIKKKSLSNLDDVVQLEKELNKLSQQQSLIFERMKKEIDIIMQQELQQMK